MKMYSLVLTAALSLFSVNSFAADIFEKVYPAVQETNPEALIIETYQEALKSQNALSAQVEKLKKDVDGVGSVEVPSKQHMLLTSFGKGSATMYGLTYLVGIPVAMQGSGNIVNLEAYVKVRVILDYAASTTTVTLLDLAFVK